MCAAREKKRNNYDIHVCTFDRKFAFVYTTSEFNGSLGHIARSTWNLYKLFGPRRKNLSTCFNMRLFRMVVLWTSLHCFVLKISTPLSCVLCTGSWTNITLLTCLGTLLLMPSTCVYVAAVVGRQPHHLKFIVLVKISIWFVYLVARYVTVYK